MLVDDVDPRKPQEHHIPCDYPSAVDILRRNKDVCRTTTGLHSELMKVNFGEKPRGTKHKKQKSVQAPPKPISVQHEHTQLIASGETLPSPFPPPRH